MEKSNKKEQLEKFIKYVRHYYRYCSVYEIGKRAKGISCDLATAQKIVPKAIKLNLKVTYNSEMCYDCYKCVKVWY
jgi:hypothetical protein